MRRFITFVAAFVMLAAPSAFAEKNYVTKELPVMNFTSVECGIPCDIEYSVGEPSFRIYADEKVVEHITNMVRDGKLTISFDKSKFYRLGDMKIWISCPKLKAVTINGAIEFKAGNGIDTDTFDANLNGASELEIKGLKADGAAINANGAASVEIEGVKCGNFAVNLNGAGGGELEGVDCGILEVAVNGAGGCDIEGHAKEANLVVNGIGGIDIKKFDAGKLTTAVNGIGKISKD